MRNRMLLIPLLAISACAAQPTGPTVAVMPAPGKTMAEFQGEQSQCKQFANQETAGAADQANFRQIGTAAIGTVLGGGLGAAIGQGRGAAIGAATGALGGTVLGAGPAAQAGQGVQYRYDVAYTQCMATYGNQVPGQPRVASR